MSPQSDSGESQQVEGLLLKAGPFMRSRREVEAERDAIWDQFQQEPRRTFSFPITPLRANAIYLSAGLAVLVAGVGLGVFVPRLWEQQQSETRYDSEVVLTSSKGSMASSADGGGVEEINAAKFALARAYSHSDSAENRRMGVSLLLELAENANWAAVATAELAEQSYSDNGDRINLEAGKWAYVSLLLIGETKPLPPTLRPLTPLDLGTYSEKERSEFRDLALDWLQQERDTGFAYAAAARSYLFHNQAETAARWMLEAAERGDKNAQVQLARLYQDAQGVPQDLIEAYKWLTISSEILYPGLPSSAGETFEDIEEGLRRAAEWWREHPDLAAKALQPLPDERD